MKEIQSKLSIDRIIKLLLIGGLLYSIYYVRDVFIILFIAWIFSLLLSPIVEFLEKYNISRNLSSALVTFSLIGVFFGVILASVPFAISQFELLKETLNTLIQQVSNQLGIETIEIDSNEFSASELLSEQSQELFKSLVSFGKIIADSIITFLIVSFLTYYLLVDKEFISKSLKFIFRDNKRIDIVYSKTETKIKQWLIGQGIMMVLVGVITYIALLIIGVKYAFPLAILAGLFEVIPFFGPTTASIPAILVALNHSPKQALIVAVLYFVIQQLQASILVPKLMDKVVGLNPIITILSILIGAKLIPHVGAILAVPITVILTIVINEWSSYGSKPDTSSSTLV